MAAIDPKLKARVLAEMVAHLRIYGPSHWKELTARYPEIPERTFFRWVSDLRNSPEAGRYWERPVDPEIAKVREGMIEDAADRARLIAATKDVPVPPSPSYLAAAGVQAEDNIDFLQMIRQTVRDIEKLRMWSLKRDPSEADGLAIRVPVVFDTTIKRRLEAAEAAVKIMREVWDLQATEEFYREIIEIILEEIGPAEPAIQERVLRRLKTLNDKRGMTMYAGMS